MTRVHNVYCFIIGQAKTDPWAVTHTDNNIDILYMILALFPAQLRNHNPSPTKGVII